MTDPISAISGYTGTSTDSIGNLLTAASQPMSGTTNSTDGTGASSGSSFANMITDGLNSVQAAQTNADTLAQQAATGDLTNVADYTVAATQASLMTDLAATIRTKGVDAFNQIMGMQA